MGQGRELTTYRTVEQKIEDFWKPPAGWHFGDGISTTDTVHTIVLELNEYAKSIGYVEREVFPAVEGGILLCLYPNNFEDKVSLEFMIYPSGLVEFEIEDNDEQINSIAGLSPDDAKKKMDQNVWRLSGTTPN